MSKKTINSHIQMPKTVLKRFEKNNRFCYYDVCKDIIGTNGHARSLNTEVGYYSAEIENFFRDNIETPLVQMLKFIESVDMEKYDFSITAEFDAVIKNFAYALIGRSPRIIPGLEKSSKFFPGLPEQLKRDVSAVASTSWATYEDFLGEYTTTLVVNKSPKPFVLPTLGIYSVSLWKCAHLIIPINPDTAVALVPKEAKDRILSNNTIMLYKLESEDDINIFNRAAFRTQLHQGYGYVVAQEKQQLIELAEEKCSL